MPMTIPGRIGRAIRGGALTSGEADRTGRTFVEWLRQP
jgi:hypothetical protein